MSDPTESQRDQDAATQASGDEPGWVRDVLGFWFREIDERAWWARDATVDATIRERFLGLRERLLADGVAADSPRGLLAAVIVLDQFSRNLFRGDAEAYAADPIARRLTRQAIAAGYDTELRPEERMFLCLPFEHSEDRADQALAVELISRLGRDDWTRHAIAHQVLIDRFGRFPHRNAVLGRKSTAEEIAALQDPANSF